MPFRFREPTDADAQMILDWRTRADVTRFMTTDIENPDIDRQRAWLASLAGRDDHRHFVIEVPAEARAIGYLSFVAIDRRHRHCSSGLYVALPEDRRRYGGLLSQFVLDYCFHALNMHKFVNEYMAGNDRLIRHQRLLGFREVGVLRQHVWKYGQWHDVHVMEMLCDTYEALPRVFPLAHTLAAFGIATTAGETESPRNT